MRPGEESTTTTAPVRPHLPPRTALTESLLVLGVSLGASAVWSVLSLARKLADERGLAAQTTALNSSATPDHPWLDLAHQLAGITLALVPVALALHLLGRQRRRPWAAIGLDLSEPGRDLLRGAGLALLIGLPGLALYLGARAAGLSTTVAAADLERVWWAVPVLLLAATQNAVLEEVVVVGYLFTRWTEAGWGTLQVVLGTALLRGTYHLYQGPGAFVGNVVMGLLLGLVYLRTRRVAPLVVAHALIDAVAFVGYALLADRLPWLG